MRLYELSETASILIHLDFLSIYDNNYSVAYNLGCFNPYSPGFSIYFFKRGLSGLMKKQLQSLFTWIFYLFENGEQEDNQDIGFNPYSPGFSIYFPFDGHVSTFKGKLQSLFTWIFYLFKNGTELNHQ